MRFSDGTWVASPSDLRRLVGCTHAVTLDRAAAVGEIERARLDDPMLEMLARYGAEHERSCLERLRDEGRSVAMVNPGWSLPQLAEAAAATREAMRAGVDVVFQATFHETPWSGQADFLLRCERPSQLGSWSYEPADAKLHSKATDDDWLQLAFYAREVARIQGVTPARLHVFTPKGKESCDAAEPMVRMSGLADQLLKLLDNPGQTEPEPVSMCDRCAWIDRCRAYWIEVDHLSLAGVDKRQRPKLRAAGIDTVTGLAEMPDATEVAGMSWPVLQRLRSDARLVLHQRRTNQPHLRLRYPREGKGLAVLPEPHPGDAYLDLEGFQFADGGQLEYLFGVHLRSDGASETFRAFWGHDRDGEKVAFEAVVDLLIGRLTQHPGAHVFHYNAYEPAALKRLAERHDTRRAEVAALLASMVDLLPIARYSVRTSSLSASLKALEVFYRAGRSGAVTKAVGSMVAYDEWRRSGDAEILREIEHYNRDDCESLADLHLWLDGLAEDVRRHAMPDDGEAEGDRALDPIAAVEAAWSAAQGSGVGEATWRRARRALVAAEFALGELPGGLPKTLGASDDEIGRQVVLGKKELGIPISRRFDQLRGQKGQGG